MKENVLYLAYLHEEFMPATRSQNRTGSILLENVQDLPGTGSHRCCIWNTPLKSY